MPKVSFILPAYKRRFLKEAIASILAQTYKDLELVVVDDHSPEGLKDVVDQFSDPRLTYYCNEENLGGKDLVAAWEKAMTYARGEWCVLASDDDLYHPEYLSEMLCLVEKHPEINVAHPRVAVIDENGDWFALATPRREIESAIELMYSRGICRHQQTMPDFIFRRSALAEIGGFVRFPVAWYSDDATWCALAKNGGIAYSSRVLFFFRSSGENISSSLSHLVEKFDASYLFAGWAKRFVRQLTPRNDEEKFMKDMILSEIDGRNLGMVRCISQKIGVFALIKLMRTSHIPRPWKIRVVLGRILDCLHIRR